MNRRHFLKSTAVATGGLVLGFYLPDKLEGAAEPNTSGSKLNAWVHISPDDTVTLAIHKAEMGQGTVTSLAMLLAEELECDWNKIKTEFPGVDPEFGPVQGVVGSQSIRTSWDLLRKTGASAREMLVSAAAQKWNVPVSQCRAENNAVVNTKTNARLSYGSLAEAASKLPVPAAPMMKDPSKFRIVGKPMKRRDTPMKVNGTAGFALDMKLPGMLYAVVARSAAFGGKITSFDATKAKAVPGVKNVSRYRMESPLLPITHGQQLKAARLCNFRSMMVRVAQRAARRFAKHLWTLLRNPARSRPMKAMSKWPWPAPQRESKRFMKCPTWPIHRWSR